MEKIEEFSQNNIKIEKKLGKGAFGEVYSAVLKSSGQKIAIKRVDKDLFIKHQNGDYLKEAFFKELECMRKCNCNNSVKYFTHFETNNHWNIIMELCDNDLSKELKKRPNSFNIEEIKDIMSQLNNAFRKLHQFNIIHRDLKLQNILIKYTDETQTKFIPKLSDYGFSKTMEKEVTSTHLGTPLTMAPEIIKGLEYNSEVDLWSIGVILYQLHFNSFPYMGANEKVILQKIKNKVPYKQPEDKELADLINKLLVEDPKKRLSWEEYFKHPFFKEEESNINNEEKVTYIGKTKRYIYKKDFNPGFKNDMYKCRIAFDQKRKKLVLIKSFHKNFIASHDFYYKKEYSLCKAFAKNNNFLNIINVDVEDNYYSHFVFDFVDCEILSEYLAHHDFTEKEIQLLNKKLFDNIFTYCQSSFRDFIFISLYSFAITKEGQPIIFDFGLNKFFLSPEETKLYYSPNLSEIAESTNSIKTNVMNYGITLLKCFFGLELKIKIENNNIVLPDDKNMSKNFIAFVSKCLKKNINKRSSWNDLKNEDFLLEVMSEQKDLNSKQKEDMFLISDKKMKGILKSLDNKYDLINKYYESLKIDEKTSYINEIEYFLILTLYEQLLLLNILEKGEIAKNKNISKEISFIYIIGNKIEAFRINFENPILKDIKIFNSNNEYIYDFIIKLKNKINKLKEISLKFHEITKCDYFSGNYQYFIKSFSKVMTNTEYQKYFISMITEANKDFLDKKFENVSIKAPIAEFICESLFFTVMIIEDIDNGKIYFELEELKKNLDEIFEKEDENNIQVSSVNFVSEKEKYILVSFLDVLIRYLINMIDIDNKIIKDNKITLKGLLNFYPKLMKMLVKTNYD